MVNSSNKLVGPAADPPGATIVCLANIRAEIDRLRDQIVEEAQRAGIDDACCFAMRLAYEEAASNALIHGNKELPDRKITVSFKLDRDLIYLRLTDQGSGFDPHAIPDPTLDENLGKPAGRGLFLMQSFMTTVAFNDKGNTVVMTRQRPASG